MYIYNENRELFSTYLILLVKFACYFFFVRAYIVIFQDQATYRRSEISYFTFCFLYISGEKKKRRIIIGNLKRDVLYTFVRMLGQMFFQKVFLISGIDKES